jgi:hypothetical protein
VSGKMLEINIRMKKNGLNSKKRQETTYSFEGSEFRTPTISCRTQGRYIAMASQPEVQRADSMMHKRRKMDVVEETFRDGCNATSFLP